MAGRPSSTPGLQAERTELAWERSAIGFLAIGAIVLFRHSGPLAEGRTALAVLSLGLALVVFRVGQKRGRQVTARRDSTGTQVVPAANTAVLVIGWATACLAIAIIAAVAVSG
jgi:putative membrane protein